MIRLTLFMKAVSFSFVVLSIQGCGESGLSKSKAKNIIEPLFKEYYDCPIPQKLHFTFKAPRLYRNVLVAKKLGLADVTQTGSDIGPLGWGSTVEKPKMGSIFTVALTEKGRSTPTMITEWDNFIPFGNSYDRRCSRDQKRIGGDNLYSALFRNS